MGADGIIGQDVGYDDIFKVDDCGEAAGQFQIDDPYPIWAELLARGPVLKGTLSELMGHPPQKSGSLYVPGAPCYSVFSYSACSDVFTRKADFGSEFYVDIGIPERFGESILSMDGLRHRRFRDVIQPYFQPSAAEGWWRENFITPLVDEIIDGFEKDRSVDLNSRFFARLPMHTVTAGFGMAPSDAVPFRRYMYRVFQHDCTLQEMDECLEAADRILGRVIAERWREPQDDLISKLAHADLEEEDGTTRKLTEAEIASYCKLIVFAGGETTWNQLGVATFALLSHPDQLAEVIADRSLLSNAILESTRWNSNPTFPRKVIRDTVLHGVELPAGAGLHLCLGAANRDPTRWDHPDAYDIHRPLQRSVAFAAGAHSCLGQHVARQEVETALNALFDRFPNIRWDPSKPPAKLTGNLIQRGPGALHVLLH